MNFLPSVSIDMIIRHDFLEHVQKRWPNRTRFYKYLLPADGNMEVHTVACKTGKRGILAKEVVRASVNDPFIYVKDIAYCNLGGYVVDWHREGIGHSRDWGYTRWESEAYSPTRSLWKLARPVINPEALQQVERFRWCAWTPESGDILDYLKTYVAHPRIELLSKAGAHHFCTRPGFVAQMERDKNLMRFFMVHIEDIKQMGYGVDVIRLAYRRGIPLSEAADRIADLRVFRRYRMPAGVDATKARAYVKRMRIGEWQFCDYLKGCVRLGMDLADTKVTFPHQFKARERIVRDRVADIERRKKAELAKEQDGKLAAVAARFACLERIRGTLRILLPRRSADFDREGKRMHNCLGDGHYAAKMARGETIIAFVRRADALASAYVAAEYDLRRHRVLQCYGSKNQKPPDQVVQFVERRFKKVCAA